MKRKKHLRISSLILAVLMILISLPVDVKAGYSYNGIGRDYVEIKVYSRNTYKDYIEKNGDGSYEAEEDAKKESALKNVTITVGDKKYTFDKSVRIPMKELDAVKDVTIRCVNYGSQVLSPDALKYYGEVFMELEPYNGKFPQITTATLGGYRTDPKNFYGLKGYCYTDILHDEFIVDKSQDYDGYSIEIGIDRKYINNLYMTVVLSQGDDNKIIIPIAGYNKKNVVSFSGANLTKFIEKMDRRPVYLYLENPIGELFSGPFETGFKLCSEEAELSDKVEDALIKGISGMDIEIDENVPIFGGANISTGWFKPPVSIERTEDGQGFRVSIGINIFTGHFDETGFYNNPEDRWFNYKSQIDELSKNISDTKEAATKYMEFKKSLTGNADDKTKKPANYYSQFYGTLQCDLLGYQEYRYVGGKLVLVESGGLINGELFAELVYQRNVPMIPIPVYLAFTFDLNAAAKLRTFQAIPEANVPFNVGFQLEADCSLKVAGGIGIKNFAGVGIYAKGGVNGSWYRDYDKIKSSGYLNGELGYEADLMTIHIQNSVLEGSYKLFESEKNIRLASYDAANKDNDKISITPASRDYAKETSKWLGESEDNNLLALSDYSVETEAVEFNPLQKNVYPNANPKIKSLDDTHMIMTWIEDDKNRDTYNRMKLVYSVGTVIDSSTSKVSWSEPKAIYDDTLDTSLKTNDNIPEIAADYLGNVYLTWQKASSPITEADAEALNILNQLEIYGAKLAFDNGYDNEPVITYNKLTENERYDYAPQVNVILSEPVFTWATQSPDNSDKYEIVQKTGLNDDQNDVTVIQKNLNYITQMVTAHVDGKTQVSIIMDADGNYDDFSDVDSYTITDGNMVRNYRENEEAKGAMISSIEYGVFDGEETLFATDGGQIYKASGSKLIPILNQPQTISGNLNVYSSYLFEGAVSILWNQPTDEGSEIWGIMYDAEEGEWTDAFQISNEGKLLNSVSLCEFPNVGEYDSYDSMAYGVCMSTERILNTETGEYENGKTDLVSFTVKNSVGIELNNIYYNETSLYNIKENNITAVVTNTGTLPIEKLKVKVKDDLGNETSNIIDVDFDAGEMISIPATYNPPDNYSSTTITVSVIPLTSSIDEDGNEVWIEEKAANNSITKEAGTSNMVAKEVYDTIIGDDHYLSANLYNDSKVSAKNVVIDVKLNSLENESYETYTQEDFSSEAVGKITSDIAPEKLKYDENGIAYVYITISADDTNGDNKYVRKIALTKKEEATPCQHSITVNMPGKEATVDEDGYTAYEECAICHAVLSGKDVIPKLKKPENTTSNNSGETSKESVTTKDTTSNNSSETSEESVDTGDTNNLAMYLFIMLMSGLAGAIIITKKNKYNN